MAFTRVTDLVDQMVAENANQYAKTLEGDAGAGRPITLTALSDATNYALSVANQDTTNGRALQIFKADLVDKWLDVTKLGVLADGFQMVQSTPGSAPGSGKTALYPDTSHVYFRPGAGAAVQLVDYTDAGAYGQVLATNSGATGLVFVNMLNANPIINGSFNIWQRGTSFTSVATGTYAADRWFYFKAGSSAVHDVLRSTDVPAVAAAHPLQNYSLLIDNTTADAAVAAGDVVAVEQRIEGFNWLPFAQRAFTLSFWVKATKTGVYCVACRNGAGDRSYVAEYTVSATDTWEYKSVSVTASPSAGTWDYTTGIGLSVDFTLMGGSTWQTTAGAWQTGNFFCTANQVNAADSTSNNFRLAQVRMTPGTAALPFAPRPTALELANCHRYYESWGGDSASDEFGISCAVITTSQGQGPTAWVPKRVTPTVSISAAANFNLGSAAASTNLSGLTITAKSPRAGAVVADTTASHTIGQAARVLANSTSARIKIDAEL
jgi:hypothetical protein